MYLPWLHLSKAKMLENNDWPDGNDFHENEEETFVEKEDLQPYPVKQMYLFTQLLSYQLKEKK